jgi:UDP-N-acetylmuramoylalanine-D-glutamate ligase
MEHPDAEDYFQSKLKLFRQCSVACVNLDADRAAEVLETAGRHARRVITFGRTPEGDVYGSEIGKERPRHSLPRAHAALLPKLRLTMPGLFNVENALAAVAVSEALGVPERYIYTGS